MCIICFRPVLTTTKNLACKSSAKRQILKCFNRVSVAAFELPARFSLLQRRRAHRFDITSDRRSHLTGGISDRNRFTKRVGIGARHDTERGADSVIAISLGAGCNVTRYRCSAVVVGRDDESICWKDRVVCITRSLVQSVVRHAGRRRQLKTYIQMWE